MLGDVMECGHVSLLRELRSLSYAEELEAAALLVRRLKDYSCSTDLGDVMGICVFVVYGIEGSHRTCLGLELVRRCEVS